MAVTKTPVGYVDSDALDRLRSDFDTAQFFSALDRLDRVRAEVDELRENLMALHSMAAYVINDNTDMDITSAAEDIHELAEIVDSGAFEMVEAAELIQQCTDALRTLDSDEVIDAREYGEDST